MTSFPSQQTPFFEMILDTGKEGAVTHAVASERPIEEWHVDHREGQLAVDVVDTVREIIVISTMAGALAERLEVFIHDDLLTIRGERRFPLDAAGEILHQECFWGKFSRTLVLPVDVKGELARAEYKGGILIVRIPKRSTDKRVPITIVEQ